MPYLSLSSSSLSSSSSSSSSTSFSGESIVLIDGDTSSFTDDGEEHLYSQSVDYYSDDTGTTEIDDIYYADYLFLDAEREPGKYYIGFHTIFEMERSNDPCRMFLSCCISTTAFFAFPFALVRKYLKMYSIIYRDKYKFKPKVEILQLSVEWDGTYTVIVKTHWLRMVQRCWRKVFFERKRVERGRGQIRSLLYFERNGKWAEGLRVMPTYVGCMGR